MFTLSVPIIDPFPRKKVAIVGSGCSGIAALWALNRTYHDVYLYEAADRLGGHTNTVSLKKGKFATQVDTGFVAFNAATYPNFMSFLQKFDIPLEPAKMDFSISRDGGVFEWASSKWSAMFSQRRNILSPRMWRLLFDVVRFNQFAVDLLMEDEQASNPESIGQYLNREGYSDAFRDEYLIPTIAAAWNTSPDNFSLDFPASTLVRFLWNHHLLSTVSTRPQWLTLRDGSRTYVDAVMKGFPPNHLFLKTAVRSVTNGTDGRPELHLENGRTEVFDHVIIATHGDQALSLIGSSATQEERAVLSAFTTTQNEVVLHSDPSLMPTRRKAWAGLNYATQTSKLRGYTNVDEVSLTYNMNVLQRIPKEPFGNVFVTLNPLQKPQKSLTHGWYYYSHPRHTLKSMRAQNHLPSIQNKRGISYAGAWTKYGLHEDGFSSGLAVATEHLGAKLPFEFKDPTYSRGRAPKLGLFDHILRLVVLLIQVFLIQVVERLAESGKRRAKPYVMGAAKKVNGKAT